MSKSPTRKFHSWQQEYHDEIEKIIESIVTKTPSKNLTEVLNGYLSESASIWKRLSAFLNDIGSQTINETEMLTEEVNKWWSEQKQELKIALESEYHLNDDPPLPKDDQLRNTKKLASKVNKHRRFVKKLEKMTLKDIFYEHIRKGFADSAHIGKRKALGFTVRNFKYLTAVRVRLWGIPYVGWIVNKIVQFPFKLRRAFQWWMQDIINPRYSNNIQGFIITGAGLLILSIGSRAVGMLKSKDVFLTKVWGGEWLGQLIPSLNNVLGDDVVRYALYLEFSLLLLYGLTMFYTLEDHKDEDSESQPADHKLLDSIKAIEQAVTKVSDQIASVDQLQKIKGELQTAIGDIETIEKNMKKSMR